MSHEPTYQAIIHVDGDAFFAYCEVAQNERLRGKPVVTGQEKGMAIAVSYEAKKRGVSRGMLMGEIRKLVPDVIILSGNYDLYKVVSRRMYNIMRRYCPRVEEYSVDECFGDVSLESDSWEDLVEIARNIKRDLEQDLGMTFSLGLAPTKTLAKVASKWKKPAGFTAMKKSDIELFLKDVPIGAVWGIGRSLSAELQKLGIKTALEFVEKPQQWVEIHFSKPVQVLWYELQGIAMHRVGQGNVEKHKSIRTTRTFRPPNNNKSFLLSQLSKNTEKACGRLRRFELQTKHVYFYLKTQTFRYKGYELRFDAPITTPSEIMNAIKKHFNEVFQDNVDYRATGVVLNAISPVSVEQKDLFGNNEKLESKKSLYKRIDAVYKKYPGSLFLASSMQARKRIRNFVHKEETDWNEVCLKLGFPYWGVAT
jgi:nucleotidyltransferase/DNA polymerase involved in DNA repair